MTLKYRWMAYRDLWARYHAVFRFFWQTRQASHALLEHEAEFLPAALAIQERPASTTARLTGRVLMLLTATLLIWSVCGKIDIVVNVKGKTIPRAHTKAIAAIEMAAVRVIHVADGQFVHAGDTLLELDASAAEAEHNKAVSDMDIARLKMQSAKALLDAITTGRRPTLPPAAASPPPESWLRAERALIDQYEDFKAKKERIDTDIMHFEQSLPIVTRRATDYQAMRLTHDVSEHAWLEKEQARIDLQGQLDDARRQRDMVVASARKEARDAIIESERIAAESEQDANRSEQHARLLRLTAPVDGTVQQLSVHTVGGVVSPAQPLMLIVPKGNQVEIEALMESRDAGFVKEGQSASVKVSTFEYTKYGTIPAHVLQVSHDSIEDEKKGLLYPIKIVFDRSSILVDGQTLALTSGLSTDVEIKTGSRRIIEYFLSPLLQHQHETLRER
ncbi:HlyD family type I secretion periplasmic adaptor subunit [Duganella hordei]|uniref:HlyD family type I secretion periplasmic adaptor subunit n=1 Tax=Duganella hordei TaxID=2865934 RepID=UPI0030E82B9B